MSKYKKNKAVALRYNANEDTAPVVIASGYGHVAEKIVDIAEKKGIPVYKDDSAASMLCMLEVGSDIPVEMYEIVAAVYRKLIETSAKIKNEEVSYYRTEDTAAADKTERTNDSVRESVRSRLLSARKKNEVLK